jgi:hypothetical protein
MDEDIGFGGFPMPHEIIHRVATRVFPKISRKLQRTFSIPPRTTTIGFLGLRTAPGHDDIRISRTKSVPAPYISFNAITGRNSKFHNLQEEELEELGGVEYRALMLLLWLVPAVRPNISVWLSTSY